MIISVPHAEFSDRPLRARRADGPGAAFNVYKRRHPLVHVSATSSPFQITTFHLLASQVLYDAPSLHTLTIREKNRGTNAVLGVMH
jgi:hypothetical protein